MDKWDEMKRELMELRVADLKAIAKEEGICLGYSSATKANTVDEIVEQRRYREEVLGE